MGVKVTECARDVCQITNCSRTPSIPKWYPTNPLTNFLVTRWLMDDISLSPMHNAGIYRTHWAIQKIMKCLVRLRLPDFPSQYVFFGLDCCVTN